MLVLIARFGGALDTSLVRAALATADGTLRERGEDIASHMTRGLTMLSKAVQNKRAGIAQRRGAIAGLRAREEAMALRDASPSVTEAAVDALDRRAHSRGSP